MRIDIKNLVSVVLLVLGLECYSQSKTAIKVFSQEELSHSLDSVITKDLYENLEDELKIVFTLKVDSLGEIHSAHIRWSNNLKRKHYYTVCTELELNYVVRFLYEKYKHEYPNSKYILCNYPYFSLRKD